MIRTLCIPSLYVSMYDKFETDLLSYLRSNHILLVVNLKMMNPLLNKPLVKGGSLLSLRALWFTFCCPQRRSCIIPVVTTWVLLLLLLLLYVLMFWFLFFLYWLLFSFLKVVHHWFLLSMKKVSNLLKNAIAKAIAGLGFSVVPGESLFIREDFGVRIIVWHYDYKIIN